MAEKKETSKRRVLTPEEVEMVTGGAIVRPTTSSALVTMEGSDKGKDKGEYVCECGTDCITGPRLREHQKTCSVHWNSVNSIMK